jgi:hypothetical protein
VDEADKGAEKNCAEAGDEADENRNERKTKQPDPLGQPEFHSLITPAPA